MQPCHPYVADAGVSAGAPHRRKALVRPAGRTSLLNRPIVGEAALGAESSGNANALARRIVAVVGLKRRRVAQGDA